MQHCYSVCDIVDLIILSKYKIRESKQNNTFSLAVSHTAFNLVWIRILCYTIHTDYTYTMSSIMKNRTLNHSLGYGYISHSSHHSLAMGYGSMYPTVPTIPGVMAVHHTVPTIPWVMALYIPQFPGLWLYIPQFPPFPGVWLYIAQFSSNFR